MKNVPPEAEFRHLLVGNLDSCRVDVGVELAFHCQTSFRSSRGDEVDNHLVADQRLAPPVLADEGEQAMFDLVPLAGARRKMADRNLQARFVGELL